MTPKKPPTISQDLPPLNPGDYDYFSPFAERPPFVPRPLTVVNWPNAWWLAEFSLLAYCTEANVRLGMAQSGFRLRPKFFIDKDAQVLVAESDDAIVVAFRGTEAPNFTRTGLFGFFQTVVDSGQDWLINAKAKLVPLVVDGVSRGKVHSGFLSAFNSIKVDLRAAIAELQSAKPRPVWYTGHSLGGALATLAAAQAGDATGLYTFGCPRVGDDQFVAVFSTLSQSARVCLSGDPVPEVPLETALFPYAHVGTSVSPVAPPLFQFSNPRRHAPMLYSVSVWNRLILESAES